MARMYKNLARYAENVLDLQLNQVAYTEADFAIDRVGSADYRVLRFVVVYLKYCIQTYNFFFYHSKTILYVVFKKTNCNFFSII